MRVIIRNERIQPMPFTIHDRPVEIKTTSLSAAPDMVPAASDLIFHFNEGETIVLTAEGGITIRGKE